MALAWLLEKDGQEVNYITAKNGWLDWTPNVQDALRLARKEDAEQLVAIVEDADRVAEHEWVDE